ncbi:MAG: FkbM family methyltransferase [Chthoniobacterales bacterium]
MRINRFYGHSVMVDSLNPSSTVLDLGANLGHFALAIVDRFHCQAFCVEPDPRVYPTLKSNPKVSAINVAVTTRSGPARFYLAQNWECSSLIPPTACETIDEIECQAVTLETVLALIGVEHLDVLKMDIEGLELELLTSLGQPILDRINQLTVEFHESMGMGTVKQVLETIDYLESFGFAAVRGSFFDYSDVLFLHPGRLKMPSNWRWLARAEKIRNGISRRLVSSVRLPQLPTGRFSRFCDS